MIDFQSSFPASGERKAKGTRSRVIGECEGNTLLFSVNTLSRTNIEKVSPDGTTVTVISFKGYMDIISASLSFDNEICHITERIPDETNFSFQSYLYSVTNGTRSKKYVSKDPITAFFIPLKSPEAKYQLIHIIGTKINHINIQPTKSQIVVSKIRCGLNFYSNIWWDYNIQTQDFSVIHKTENTMVLSTFHFTKNKIKTYPIQAIIVNEDQILSDELSNSPLSLTHLPYYQFNKRRIYLSIYKDKILVVQQLNDVSYVSTQQDENNTYVSFMVSVFPENFNDIVTIKVSSTDVPIAFLKISESTVVYVPNEFYTFINFVRGKTMLYTYRVQKKNPELTVSNRIQPLWNTTFVIDLSNGNIFNTKVCYYELFTQLANDSLSFIEPSILSLLAQRSTDSQSIAAFLYYLQTHWDAENAISYIEEYFNCCGKSLKGEINDEFYDTEQQKCANNSDNTEYLKHYLKNQDLVSKIQPSLSEMESTFHSQCKYSRTQCFVFLMNLISKSKTSKTTEECAFSALKTMERQDIMISLLREAICKWKLTYNPPLKVFYSLLRIIQYISIIYVFPRIDGLDIIINNIKRDEADTILETSINLEHILSARFAEPEKVPSFKTARKKSDTYTSQFDSCDEQTFSFVEL